MVQFSVDPNKLSYWDLLGDVKELGYDIKKDVSLSCTDSVGVLGSICTNQDIVGLNKKISVKYTLDIYIECSEVCHGKKLLGVLLSVADGNAERDALNDVSISSGSECSTNGEERLAFVPFVNDN